MFYHFQTGWKYVNPCSKTLKKRSELSLLVSAQQDFDFFIFTRTAERTTLVTDRSVARCWKVKMALRELGNVSLKCFSSVLRLSTAQNVNSAVQLRHPLSSTLPLVLPTRYSSYRSSKPEGPSELYTNVEILTSPPEWKYVERLLPLNIVPKPTIKDEYPSGWAPPQTPAKNLPYFVQRTKNHMMSVYLQLGFRGMRKITQVRRIQGDIWELEKDLKDFLERKLNKKVATQVHEVNCHVNVKGDYVNIIKEWMLNKGF